MRALVVFLLWLSLSGCSWDIFKSKQTERSREQSSKDSTGFRKLDSLRVREFSSLFSDSSFLVADSGYTKTTVSIFDSTGKLVKQIVQEKGNLKKTERRASAGQTTGKEKSKLVKEEGGSKKEEHTAETEKTFKEKRSKGEVSDMSFLLLLFLLSSLFYILNRIRRG